MHIKSLKDLLEHAKKYPVKKLAIACAGYYEILYAIKNISSEFQLKSILIGRKSDIEKISNKINFAPNSLEIINSEDDLKACEMAVELVRTKNADILMKGMISTGTFLKPVVDRDSGLLKGKLLSHFALFESPYYHKLLGIADVAINIAPDLAAKVEILKNSVEIYHKIGISNPKVAVITPVETINEKIASTIDALALTKMNKNNQINDCIVEGPLALDNAISKKAAQTKNITGEVIGDADILIVPDLNSGNILYKTLNFLGGASSASIVAGASVPIVLTSRADSKKCKLMSIALAYVTT